MDADRQRTYNTWSDIARKAALASASPLHTKTNAKVTQLNAETHGNTPSFDYLRGYADTLGVVLMTVQASGPGGVSRDDIDRKAGINRTSATGVAAGSRPFTHRAPAHSDHTAQADRNPLVAAAWRDLPVEAAQAQAHAPEPTLFSAGDLPDFTASGVDPKVLLRAPWNARQALAAEPSSVAVFRAVELFNGLDAPDAEALAQEEGLDGPGVADYHRRVQDWLLAGLTEDQVYGLMGFDEPGGPRYAPLAYDPNKTPKQDPHDDSQLSQLGLTRAKAKKGEHIPGGLPRKYDAAAPAVRTYPTPRAQARKAGAPTAEDAQFKSLSERFGW